MTFKNFGAIEKPCGESSTDSFKAENRKFLDGTLFHVDCYSCSPL